MTNLDVVYDKIHFRHDLRWSERVTLGDGGARVCLACVIELMERDDISAVRKSMALAGVLELLRNRPGVLRELLLQDERVCLQLTASLLKSLHSVEDPAVVERVMQVLLQLLLDVQSEQTLWYVLSELQTECEQGASVRVVLPLVVFLGKLVDAVPALLQTLASSQLALLERCVCVLLSPDEALKAAVCYVLARLWGCTTAAQSVPTALRDRVCVLVLHTLTHASSPNLTVNCLGVLKQMLKFGEVVCVLMNCELNSSECNVEKSMDNSQSTQPSLEHCSLPLILKKLLLSGDEVLQVASVQCMCAVLVHSPSQYCSPFIKADVPEFLFERVNSSSEVMLWTVYGCLLLLTEDLLFFSHCHSVYGIESLVRSLKGALKLSNLEVHKQGLLLLTVILERQPAGVRLFPAAPAFVGVAEVVLGGVASACLQVATQAARAAAAVFRVNHQSSPVQYRELIKIVEAVMARCSELPLSSVSRHTTAGTFSGPESSCQSSRTGKFLLQTLHCIQEACSLAEQCNSEPRLKENVFSAPDKQNEDTLESLCVCLLHCCDKALIPKVITLCERSPSAQVLKLFFSILSSQFTLSPSHMPAFTSKLASSGFIRFSLENKALLCSGNRNTSVNVACSGFVLTLCMSLLSQEHSDNTNHIYDDVEAVLRLSLPSLSSRVSDWPSVLCEGPEPDRHTQYCLLLLMYLSRLHGDRLFPDSRLFACVVRVVVCWVQEQADSPPPPAVLRSVLFLLAVSQDSNPDLDWAPLNSLSKALSSCPLFSSVCSHHPSVLHFIFRYPELSERFGLDALSLWLSHGFDPEPSGATESSLDMSEQNSVLLVLMEKRPTVILTLLGMACDGEARVRKRAACVLRCYLWSERVCDSAVASLLKPALLQILQRLNWESGDAQTTAAVVLRFLCLVQSVSVQSDMDGTDLKLLYHVSNLVAKLKCTDMEPLLPAFNYIYCCLNQWPKHCTDRAVSMLLCNTGLMEKLQMVLNVLPPSSSVSSFSSLPPSSALFSSSSLLLSSLITLQHTHSAQVHKSISVNLHGVVKMLAFRKREADSLLLACALRLLQAMFDVDLSSGLLCVSEVPGVWQRPLQAEDSVLYPLGSRAAHCLMTTLYGLMLQKQELLLCVTVNCMRSLIHFLQRRNPATARHLLSQPWSRLLLYTMLNSGESYLLHPATLSLLTVMVHWRSEAVQWDSDLVCVCEAVEKTGVKTLEERTVQALRLLLTQCSVYLPTLTDGFRLRAQSLLQSLNCPSAPQNLTAPLLHFGEVHICPADYTVNTDAFQE